MVTPSSQQSHRHRRRSLCVVALTVVLWLGATAPATGLPLSAYKLPAGYLEDHAVDKAIAYLRRFGYIEDEENSIVMGRAITNFQYMADIAQTGRLDDVTLRKMEEPRCGVKDSFLQEDGAPIAAKVQYRPNRRSRIKSAKLRQGLGAGFFSRWWFKCDFTWNVINGHDKRSRDVTRTLVRRALSQWSNAINRGRRSPIFTFREEPDRNDTDLRFSYEKGKHGDSNAFDGPQGVLAHAFFPYISGDFEGQLHIDGDEDWQGSSSVGQLLYYVIMHEIGHIFGLTHSNKESSVMYGYLGFERSSIRHLRHEDIKRIRAHYPYRFCDIYAKRHSSLLDSNYKKTQRATPAPGTKH